MKKALLLAAVVVILAGAAYSDDKPSLRPPVARPLTAFMVEELESWESRHQRERDRALAPLPTLSKGKQLALGEQHG